jgi:hypothetical protein
VTDAALSGNSGVANSVCRLDAQTAVRDPTINQVFGGIGCDGIGFCDALGSADRVGGSASGELSTLAEPLPNDYHGASSVIPRWGSSHGT